MGRLSQRAVPSRIPNRETNPFLPRRVEGQAELTAAERSRIFQINQLAVHLGAVAPNEFGKFWRKRPFRFRRVSSLRA